LELFDKRIEPDVDALLSVIRREKRPRRVHHIELFLDEEIKDVIGGRLGLGGMPDILDYERYLARDIELHRLLGYDIFRIDPVPGGIFPLSFVNAGDTTSISGQERGERQWTEEHQGLIQSWKDFERYPWPGVSDLDMHRLEWLEKNLPENMGCYDLTAHIMENLTFLLGYETFCFKLVDEPDLIDAMLEKIGRFFVDYTNLLCNFSCVKAVWGSDDMGFRSGPLASPSFLREKILPWHAACARAAHERGRPYLLHNCGKIDSIMDDLIDVVRIDAKHSFEDTIMPVTEAFRKWGDSISILGGIDVDFLCRSDENAIRERVRQTLDVCMTGTGYCLGTGNTVANYMPVNKFLAMVDEGRKYAL